MCRALGLGQAGQPRPSNARQGYSWCVSGVYPCSQSSQARARPRAEHPTRRTSHEAQRAASSSLSLACVWVSRQPGALIGRSSRRGPWTHLERSDSRGAMLKPACVPIRASRRLIGQGWPQAGVERRMSLSGEALSACGEDFTVCRILF